MKTGSINTDIGVFHADELDALNRIVTLYLEFAELQAMRGEDDDMLELMLEEKDVPEDMIHRVLRRGTLANDFAPVLMGSAYKNKGVQLLLDAMTRYLPSPLDRDMHALDIDNGEAKTPIKLEGDQPLVCLAFKLVDETFGQLTYMRIYQGKMVRGDRYKNSRDGKLYRFGRILRMHADDREEIESASAGDIVAVVGIDCVSGDTFSGEGINYSMESMHVMDPVISLSVAPASTKDRDKMAKALNRFAKEDPTFRLSSDEDTGETIISGMGELHLDVYCERIRREYKCELEIGRPRVSYRESPSISVKYDYKHKKQTGGSGQYAHVVGSMRPMTDEETRLAYEHFAVVVCRYHTLEVLMLASGGHRRVRFDWDEHGEVSHRWLVP